MNLERKLVAQNVRGKAEVIVIENGLVVEYLTDQCVGEAPPGAIYKGRVIKTFPKWPAALVDIGLKKPAYLELTDWPGQKQNREDSSQESGSHFPQPGESLIVQIERQATDFKGAKLTGLIQLAGRLLVYLPYGRAIKLSRRIAEQDRKRLISLAQQWLQVEEGIIFRTMATHYAEHDLEEELKKLREKWRDIRETAGQLAAPGLLDSGENFWDRIRRDFITPELQECVVGDPYLFQLWEQEKRQDPYLSFKLTLDHKGGKPLFTRLGLDHEIKQLGERRVKLKSGGYLVIDETEALTVIDVNGGGLLERAEQEEGALITNLEAAQETARQIRLRDIGGIVVIDFIRLAQKANRDKVLDVLIGALKADRRETHVLGYTALGLVELTRKKKGISFQQATTQPCPLCLGRGRV